MSKTVYRYNGSVYTPSGSTVRARNAANGTVICLVIMVVVLAIVCISLNLTINRASADNDTISGVYNANSVYEPLNTGGPANTDVNGSSPDTSDLPSYNSPGALKLYGDEKTASIGSSITSEYAIVVDGNTGHILASKKSSERIYPASLTKVMSAIVAYEYMINNDVDIMSTYLEISQDIIDYTYREGASNAGFKKGEKVRIYDVFHGVIVPSGADATLMLAEFCYGGKQEFVNMMNNKAAELGLEDTHFVTCTGLHNKDHYTTVRDLAVILDYACRYDYIKYLMQQTSYTYPETNVSSARTATSTLYRWRVNQYNKTLSKSQAPGSTQFGGKSGYTPEAKCCLFTFAEDSNGNEYIVVTCYANSGKIAVTDYMSLYSRFCSLEG